MKKKIKDDAKAVLGALEECYHSIYTAGNGGSASIANHMACDWMKGTYGHFEVTSLVTNTSLLTALANDYGYENTIVEQLKWHHVNLLVLVSSSGTSPNIVKAAEHAKRSNIPVVAFTGFSGGPLKKLADFSVHISSMDYGVVEDFHSQVMHEVLRQWRKNHK